MSRSVIDLVAFLDAFVSGHPGCSKDELARATAVKFDLRRERSVYFCAEFGVRFSSASGRSFSNVVLSLSTLRKYDHTPFVVCVVRPTGIQLLLANTTFLTRISHSSHRLTADNVRGSFLGHDIARTYSNLQNTPANFEALFKLHTERTWEANLVRLVEQTRAISATGVLYEPSAIEAQRILQAPALARLLSDHPEYMQLHVDLSRLVQDSRHDILVAGQIDNVNVRGNTIEQIVSRAGNFHGVEDISRTLTLGTEVKVDIKTKILSLSSSPKGYNIEKVLRALSNGSTVISIFFVGVELEEGAIFTRLVSIFDRTILNVTRIQPHWAGRNSRGVTQLSGDLMPLFRPDFEEDIDIAVAQAFLQRLIDVRPS